MTSKLISIKSVLFDISTLIPETEWDETRFMEWAIKGFRKIGVSGGLEDHFKVTALADHKAQLPEDMRYLTQVIYKTDLDTGDIDDIKELLGLDGVDAEEHMVDPTALPNKVISLNTLNQAGWKPMRLASSPFVRTIILSDIDGPYAEASYNCPECSHEFTVDSSLCLTSTLRQGLLIVAYKRYPVDDCGDVLIPDHEDLKDAILHFVLYRYFLRKSIMSEQAAEGKAENHLMRFQTLLLKSKNLEYPNMSQLENMKGIEQAMPQRRTSFDEMFSRF